MADTSAETKVATTPADLAAGSVQTPGVVLAIVDFPLLAAGYRAVIDGAPDLRLAGVADHLDRVPEQVARLAADVVVIGWPSSADVESGPTVTIAEIQAARPAARILAIDTRCGSLAEPPATAAGAHGFLAREAAPGDVLAALRCLGRGETAISPASSHHALPASARPGVREAADDPFEALSERAREVFVLAAVGHSSQEIARRLGISEQAVHNHRALIMRQLGLNRRVELLRYALRRGIIQASEL